MKTTLRALETAEVKVRALKAIIHEAQAADEAQCKAGTEAASKVGIGRRSRAIERSVRNASEVMRTSAKGKRGSR
jgi:hypothetical protein